MLDAQHSDLLRGLSGPELEAVQLQAGQAVEVRFDALPEVVLTGRLAHLDQRYVEKRGDITFTAKIDVTEPEPLLRWGLTAVVRFAP